MSHEFRTPLNSILAFTHLSLEEGNLPPFIVEYMKAVITSSSALLGVVNQVLSGHRSSPQLAMFATMRSLFSEPGSCF